MSYGLAACQTGDETMFTGPELYEQIMKLDFVGASGTVNFDNRTGLRDPRAVEYLISNVVSYNGTALYEGQNSTFNNSGGDFAASVIHKIIVQPSTATLETMDDLAFPFGSTKPPRPISSPRIVYYNLMPLRVNSFCWAFAGIVMLLSLGFGGWTLLHFDHPRIRTSQPIFLIPLCLGKNSRFRIPFDLFTSCSSQTTQVLS
jgi:hypothetical protein